jgi:hypothetical protein
MSTDRLNEQQAEFETTDFDGLKSLHCVGEITVQRLKQSSRYDTVRNVADSHPTEINAVIDQNYADAVQIKRQLKDGDLL